MCITVGHEGLTLLNFKNPHPATLVLVIYHFRLYLVIRFSRWLAIDELAYKRAFAHTVSTNNNKCEWYVTNG
jgi:hypothetical protein